MWGGVWRGFEEKDGDDEKLVKQGEKGAGLSWWRLLVGIWGLGDG